MKILSILNKYLPKCLFQLLVKEYYQITPGMDSEMFPNQS